MLLIDTKAHTGAAKGSVITALVEVGTERVLMARGGYENRPVLGGAILAGLPISSPYPEVKAPIDLAPGDLVRLVASHDNAGVYAVQRGKKTIYSAQ